MQCAVLARWNRVEASAKQGVQEERQATRSEPPKLNGQQRSHRGAQLSGRGLIRKRCKQSPSWNTACRSGAERSPRDEPKASEPPRIHDAPNEQQRYCHPPGDQEIEISRDDARPRGAVNHAFRKRIQEAQSVARRAGGVAVANTGQEPKGRSECMYNLKPRRGKDVWVPRVAGSTGGN